MALITRKARATILIGINPASCHIRPEDTDQFMIMLNSRMAKNIPEYAVMVYPAESSTSDILIFNAYINFEIAVFEDGLIKYPALSQRVQSILKTEISSFISEPGATGEKPVQPLSEIIGKCKNTLYLLDVINRINPSISDHPLRLSLSVSDQPEITLKNYRNEVLMIATRDSTEQKIKQIINLILHINNTAFSAGESSVTQNHKTKPNSYGAVDTQDFEADVFGVHDAYKDFLNEKINSLNTIDPDRHILFHEDTVLTNFKTGFKHGVVSRLSQLTQHPGL